jgi:hypothetical protein
MPNEMESNTSLAVLIDADNANPSIIEGLLAEVAKLGVASVKRIYGDWTHFGRNLPKFKWLPCGISTYWENFTK